jgi:hypothetical protein
LLEFTLSIKELGQAHHTPLKEREGNENRNWGRETYYFANIWGAMVLSHVE